MTINIPDKIPATQIDDDSTPSPSMSGELPTCGWLLEQVEKKYAQLIKELKQSSHSKPSTTKLKKKLIVALKTVDKNENIDFWLTQYSR